jgi:formate/nitrite transporter FocA (FNT family)
MTEGSHERLDAQDIFKSAANNGRKELERSTHALAISGLAGGIVMGLTGLSVAVVQALLGTEGLGRFISFLFYPIGFVAVIVGRAQLFTENTLYPVLLILHERRHVLNTLRLWSAVFFANILGAFLFALLVMKTGALRADFAAHLAQLGVEATQRTSGELFWSGVMGGWLIALVAWNVTAARESIGELSITWLLTFVVGISHFAHCIAGSCEVFSAVLFRAVPAHEYLRWIVAATLGNILGGVVLVSLLNFGQVHADAE